MMLVSERVEQARSRGCDRRTLAEIEDHLYRGQCNCPYWHGAFGGVYLPHLRNAIYSELIAAENRLDQLEHGNSSFVEANSEDFDFDLLPEVRLANDQLIAFVSPAKAE